MVDSNKFKYKLKTLNERTQTNNKQPKKKKKHKMLEANPLSPNITHTDTEMEEMMADLLIKLKP